jgi:hypothetical protein
MEGGARLNARPWHDRRLVIITRTSSTTMTLMRVIDASSVERAHEYQDCGQSVKAPGIEPWRVCFDASNRFVAPVEITSSRACRLSLVHEYNAKLDKD